MNNTYISYILGKPRLKLLIQFTIFKFNNYKVYLCNNEKG